jgi:hypothetical protein
MVQATRYALPLIKSMTISWNYTLYQAQVLETILLLVAIKLLVKTRVEISPLILTEHVDNAIGHVDASGDMKFDSNLSFDGTTLALNGTMTVGSQLQFTDNRISTTNSNENIDLVPNGTGTVNFAVPSQTTVGSAGSASAPPARPTTYLKIRVHGTEFAIPAYAVS